VRRPLAGAGLVERSTDENRVADGWQLSAADRSASHRTERGTTASARH
jgi:hypothetical protein